MIEPESNVSSTGELDSRPRFFCERDVSDSEQALNEASPEDSTVQD